jgi:hypothetical protein
MKDGGIDHDSYDGVYPCNESYAGTPQLITAQRRLEALVSRIDADEP